MKNNALQFILNKLIKKIQFTKKSHSQNKNIPIVTFYIWYEFLLLNLK